MNGENMSLFEKNMILAIGMHDQGRKKGPRHMEVPSSEVGLLGIFFLQTRPVEKKNRCHFLCSSLVVVL